MIVIEYYVRDKKNVNKRATNTKKKNAIYNYFNVKRKKHYVDFFYMLKFYYSQQIYTCYLFCSYLCYLYDV